MTVIEKGLTGEASFSECKAYRYTLTRELVPPTFGDDVLVWLMLNPSTADAFVDDHTIRKVMGFSIRNGAHTAVVVNLFALRATDPKKCRSRLVDAEGPDNIAAIMQATTLGRRVVCAWGAFPWARPQARRVLRALEEQHPEHELLCLATASAGDPRHPLMVGYKQGLQRFRLPAVYR